MTDKGTDDETYSIIYAALKHPIRRRILRMLNEEELTYTQMLNKLDIDTGHLNYHLESLGELLAKTTQGKYRLSEFGNAAVNLMSGVEETSIEPPKIRFSTRKFIRLSQIISIVALVLVGLLLMNIGYVSTYYYAQSGSLDERNVRIVQPNGTLLNYDHVSAREFPVDTLTTHYRTFFQIEVAHTNVSLHIQLIESIYYMGDLPVAGSEDKYSQGPTVIYDKTWVGPLDKENVTQKSVKLGYIIQVPIKSPQEKGLLVSNSFTFYNTTITNLGAQMIERNSSGHSQWVTYPNNTGSLNLQTSYPFIEKTDYPYFYYGVSLIVLAAVIAVLPYLPLVKSKVRKK